MKKMLYFIKDALMTVFIVAALILTAVCIVIAAPFRCLQYRKSHFYRDTGIRFSIGIMDHTTFQLYELIRAQDLPIRYLMPRDPKRPMDGWFLAGTTLLIHDLPGLFYEEALGGWAAYPEDKEPLSDTVAGILLNLRTDYPDVQIGGIRILMDLDEQSAEHIARAQQDPLFLMYSELEELPELLRTLNQT